MGKSSSPGIKNILMLHSSSDLYGASKIFLHSVFALNEAGHKVYVVLSEDGPLNKELQGIGAEVIFHKLGILRRKYFTPSGLINRIRTIINAIGFLEDLVKEKKITHLYSNTAAVLAGAFVARKTGTKHLWHLHEILLSPSWFVWLMGKIINTNSDKVMVVSQAVWENWKGQIDESKLVLVHNGINYQPYLQSKADFRSEIAGLENKVLVGMIGRINHWKGQGYFLDIAKILVNNHKNVHFILVGDAFPGTEHFVDEMKQKIEDLGLKSHVSYLGFRNDIPEILQSVDVFVLPSILPDPFPTVILEAMASGKPVVATAQGGAKEMVLAGETGLLIPWDNPELAAEAIFGLINDKELREKMGEKSRTRVLEKFSSEAYQKNFISLFEND